MLCIDLVREENSIIQGAATMAENNFQNNRPAKIKTLLDDSFLRLSAPCPTPAGAGKKSTLRVVLNKNNPQSLNNPHLVVYTNDPTEKDRDTDYGKITAKFDFFGWGMFMEYIQEAPNWENGKKEFIDCKDHIFAGGKRSEAPVVTARVTIQKDMEGVINVAITAKGRPHIVFKLLPPAGFLDMRNGDGTPVSDAVNSARYCRMYYNIMTKVVAKLMVEGYVAPAPYDPQNKGGGNGGGGGGGGNYGGNRGGGGGNGGGGGGGSSGGSWGGGDDDIPF